VPRNILESQCLVTAFRVQALIPNERADGRAAARVPAFRQRIACLLPLSGVLSMRAAAPRSGAAQRRGSGALLQRCAAITRGCLQGAGIYQMKVT